VSKVTRGERASASLRLTICGAAAVAGCAPGATGWPDGACGVPVVPGVVVCCWVVVLTGALVGGKAYCQPMMINTESTIATIKFF